MQFFLIKKRNKKMGRSRERERNVEESSGGC
jgi:hypothetical protein